MESITCLIRNEIKRQYKSIKKFSEVSGIPYSTLSNALSKGIGGTSYDTVVKICKILNLKQVYDDNISILNDQFHEIYTMLSSLDKRGLHTVKTILSVEYARCMNKPEATIKAFNGIGFASEKIDFLSKKNNSTINGKGESDDK